MVATLTCDHLSLSRAAYEESPRRVSKARLLDGFRNNLRLSILSLLNTLCVGDRSRPRCIPSESSKPVCRTVLLLIANCASRRNVCVATSSATIFSRCLFAPSARFQPPRNRYHHRQIGAFPERSSCSLFFVLPPPFLARL